MTNEKLRIYFKDGNKRTIRGSYRDESKSIDVLLKLITTYATPTKVAFKGTYTTALIYDRNDKEAHKFVNDKKIF